MHQIIPTKRARPWSRLLYANGRAFCIVRDPVERFLSAYHNRVHDNRDIEVDAGAKTRAAGLSVSPDLTEFIDNFDRYRRHSPSIRHHFRPLWRYLGPRPDRYDRIFNLREMAALSVYCAEAGAPLNLERENTRKSSGRSVQLSAKQRAFVEGLYARDYAVFDKWF